MGMLRRKMESRRLTMRQRRRRVTVRTRMETEAATVRWQLKMMRMLTSRNKRQTRVTGQPRRKVKLPRLPSPTLNTITLE